VRTPAFNAGADDAQRHRRSQRQPGRQGIPPASGIASAVARCTDFAPSVRGLASTRREIMPHRRAGVDTSKIFRIAGPLAEPGR
jgi:hypothetical protein